ncbi:hypothetical protein PRV_00100 [Mycoplasma parvum str. Indiana]|uniref:Small ribosomal subunit protein bS6 n=2 Tax=Mycoplasma parvum TaxID=984991 RepID=U5NBW1_9MOLU|nr:hypothetical protein PRV_00100 [Mycoplasma parvum str. Indiana]
MFLIDAEYDEEGANKVVSPLLALFEKESDYKLIINWAVKLAYPIKKRKNAHRYLINFETNDISKIEEFKRLFSLNHQFLRYLVINLEKTYGYKNSINPKKIAKAQRKAQKYEEFRSKRQSRNYDRAPQKNYSQTI